VHKRVCVIESVFFYRGASRRRVFCARSAHPCVTKCRKCRYNVTVKRVRVAIVAVESNKYYMFWVSVYSLSYPACSAHAPYCHLWPVRIWNIFQGYLINCTISVKKWLSMKYMFWFSATFVLNISHSEKNSARCCWSSCKVAVILFRFQWNLSFIESFWGKSSNIKVYENSSIGSRVVPCRETDRQTDRYDEAISRFSQFFQSALNLSAVSRLCFFIAHCSICTACLNILIFPLNILIFPSVHTLRACDSYNSSSTLPATSSLTTECEARDLGITLVCIYWALLTS
jgi:hypothetical protein